MIVLDAVRGPEASRCAEIGALEDDSLWEHDAGIRFGARHRIPDRDAFDLDVLTASEARLHVIEREIVRDGPCTFGHVQPSTPPALRPCLRAALQSPYAAQHLRARRS